MKISVIVAIYKPNRKYLLEELDSISAQSEIPDEVILIDDNSSDGTVEFLTDYIGNSKLNIWKLVENQTNIGCKDTFIKGMSLATGDVVFLADQDDLWNKDRVRIMRFAMEKTPSAAVLCCDFISFKEDNPIAEDYSKIQNDNISVELLNTEKDASINHPGCTYCIRTSFYKDLSHCFNHNSYHDIILYTTAWMQESLYCVHYKLHLYRRHSNALSLASTEYNKYKRLNRVRESYSIMLDVMSHYRLPETLTNRRIKAFELWHIRRINVLEKQTPKRVFFVLMSFRFYRSIMTIFVDILPERICMLIKKFGL